MTLKLKSSSLKPVSFFFIKKKAMSSSESTVSTNLRLESS